MTSTGAHPVLLLIPGEPLDVTCRQGQQVLGQTGTVPIKAPLESTGKLRTSIKCQPRTIQPSKSDKHLLNRNVLTSPAYACYEPSKAAGGESLIRRLSSLK
jgi:hypothetical protein